MRSGDVQALALLYISDYGVHTRLTIAGHRASQRGSRSFAVDRRLGDNYFQLKIRRRHAVRDGQRESFLLILPARRNRRTARWYELCLPMSVARAHYRTRVSHRVVTNSRKHGEGSTMDTGLPVSPQPIQFQTGRLVPRALGAPDPITDRP
jgi:hypothetical protein